MGVLNFGVEGDNALRSSIGRTLFASPVPRPKALLTFHNKQVEWGSARGGAIGLGMATHQVRQAGLGTSFSSTGGRSRDQAGHSVSDMFVVMHEQSPALRSLHSLLSIDNHDFIINTSNAATPDRFGLCGFGGPVVNADILNITSPMSTGKVRFRGLPFKPDLVIMATVGASGILPTTKDHADLSVGLFNESEQACLSAGSKDHQRTMDTYHYYSTSACLSHVHDNTQVIAASQVKMEKDGFTLNFHVINDNPMHISCLCLSGIQSYIGVFAERTQAGQFKVDGVPFDPTGLLMFGVSGTTRDVVASDGQWSLGMAGGVPPYQQFNTATYNPDRVSSAGGYSSSSEDFIHQTLGDGGIALVRADFRGFASNGFNLNFNIVDGIAREVIYVATCGVAGSFWTRPPNWPLSFQALRGGGIVAGAGDVL